MEKKELYISKDFEGLSKYLDISKLKVENVKFFCKLLEKLYEKYESAKLDRDEELSYISAIRFLDTYMKWRKNFRNDQKYIDAMVNLNKITKTFEHAEELKVSLKLRYDVLKEQDRLKDLELEKAKRPYHQIGEEVSSEWLYKAVKNNANILIVDVRSSNEFSSCHVEFVKQINIPSNELDKGASVIDVERLISQRKTKGDMKYWEMRGNVESVVIVDWDEDTSQSREDLVKKAIWFWDAEKLLPEPTRLIGGLKAFLRKYPTIMSNSQYKGPMPFQNGGYDLNTINYPEFDKPRVLILSDSESDDEKEPVKSNVNVKLQPNGALNSFSVAPFVVDRSLKPMTQTNDILKQFQTTDSSESNSIGMKRSASQPNLIDTSEISESEAEDSENLAISEEIKFEDSKTPPNIDRNKKPLIGNSRPTPVDPPIIQPATNGSTVTNPSITTPPVAQPSPPSIPRTSKPIIKAPTTALTSITSAQQHQQQQITQNLQLTNFTASQINNLNPTYRNVKPGVTGLRNLGNTCYMSSIIQALSNTRVLMTYLLSGNFVRDINRSNPLGHKGHMVREMASLIQALWCGKYSEVSPQGLRQVVTSGNSIFRGTSQHDSQEFLLYLLDGLHEDLNQRKLDSSTKEQSEAQVVDSSISSNSTTNSPSSEEAWNRYIQVNNSIIVTLFQGMYRSTVQCEICSYSSLTYEPFMYLSLPVPHGGRPRLKDCLSLYLARERMTGPSQWFCPRCKQSRDATKKIELWRVPPYLLIHLKRFNQSAAVTNHQLTAATTKLTSLVDFPIAENLPLSNWLDEFGGASPKLEHSQYRLYAVSNHQGNMESGHYTSYCKNFKTNDWFNYDDNLVLQIKETEVKTSTAYILFYESISIQQAIR